MKKKCNDTLERLAEEYDKKVNLNIIKKTSNLFNLVTDFIISNKLILYGGFAINILLPENNKIYDDSTINDFDCFSKTPKKHAKELSNILARNGFKYIEVKPGIHPGTWKVFVEFISVCDITDINAQEYDRMIELIEFENKEAKTMNNFYIAPKSFLKRELCYELSQPATSSFRWSKLMNRFIKFNKSFPNKLSKKVKQIYDKTDKELNDMALNIIKICKEFDVIFIGNIAIDLHKGLYRETKTNLNIYSEYDCFVDVIYIEPTKILEKLIESYGNIFKIVEINNRTIISKDGINLLSIYNGKNGCYSYCKKKGMRVGTVFTILYFLYCEYMNKQLENPHDILQNIDTVYKIMKTMSCENHCFMNIICYGEVKDMRQIRKDSWNKKLSKYRPSNNKKMYSLFNTEIYK